MSEAHDRRAKQAPVTADAARPEGQAAAASTGHSARLLVDGSWRVVFFASVLLAAFPLGANRDWAWAPIAVLIGGLAMLHALGVGGTAGHRVRSAERALLWLMLFCCSVLYIVALVQMSPEAPAAWHAELYVRAAHVLGRDVSGMPSLNADVTRAALLRIVTCAMIFLMARSLCRDRRLAQLYLVLFIAGAVLVMTYGLVMHATTGSCYVFNYSRRADGAPPSREFLCAMSGTFVSSNSFAAYAGMGMVAALGLALSRRSESNGDPWLSGSRVAFLAAVFYLLGGVLLSASRAGFAVTVFCSILLCLLYLRGHWLSRPAVSWAIVAVLFAIALLVLVAGGAIFHKTANSGDVDILGRVRIWQVAGDAIARAPWLGWGLGSFIEIYALLQPPDLAGFNDKAHSTPLEWIVDIGLPAAFFAFTLLILPVCVCLHGAWHRRSDRHLPAIAAAVTLVPILHSLVDFSLQIPAIAFVTSALLGLGWAQAWRRHD